ncbi:MAG TPA: hypothetical protein VF136_08445 [Methylomirabilota bacterium]
MLRLRFALLVAIVAVIAHDATFLIGHGLEGYPAALGATGHDGHWLPVAIGVAGLLLGAAIVAAARWWRLRSQLAELAGDATDHRIGPVARGALGLAWRLFAAALAVFVIQENLEAIAIGAPAPGPGIVLAPAYLAAVPALAAVALLFAVTSELIDARILHLERALERARNTLPRPSAAAVRRPTRSASQPLRSRSAQPDLGRAPPASAHP